MWCMELLFMNMKISSPKKSFIYHFIWCGLQYTYISIAGYTACQDIVI